MTARTLRLFGLHLAWLRKQRGWSQETLSLESGLSRSYLSGIEGGKRNVALANICTLADTLAVSPMDMLDFNQHDTTALRVEELRARFGNTQHVAIEATLRHMAELNDAELNLVAAVARALARKGSFR
ncbi:helix-turn-helix domain-containing protein [Cupriavidus sp. IDO]|uniref:helix-turn-helix domain-containing protein n=1 Tax=Cupriavidus sp. IDO TaxID=1539142 RepID=UPI0005791E52|nr:helix-turn-helix transcriptional regulator [Cupriavidus sp. IDO]KWR89854.1 XRE family transcriptional regulator [Cupriavidus sp. IDO]